MGVREDILAAAIFAYVGSNPDNDVATVTDDSGNGNTATRQPNAGSGPQWVNDSTIGRYALEFSGQATEYVTFPQIQLDADAVGFGVSLWCRLVDASVVNPIFSTSGTAVVRQILWTGSGLLIEMDTNGNTVQAPYAQQTVWRHCLFNAPGDGEVAIYIDGSLQVSADPGTPTITLDQIGRRGTLAATFEGRMADVIVRESPFTTEEIAWLADVNNTFSVDSGNLAPVLRSIQQQQESVVVL